MSMPRRIIRLMVHIYIRYKSGAVNNLATNFDMMWEEKMGRKDLLDLSEELQQKMTNKAGQEFKKKRRRTQGCHKTVYR